jgi:hypothetical protein
MKRGGYRPRKAKIADYYPPGYSEEDNKWIDAIVKRSPLADDDYKRTIAESALVLRLQIRWLRANMQDLTDAQRSALATSSQKLISAMTALGLDGRVPAGMA